LAVREVLCNIGADLGVSRHLHARCRSWGIESGHLSVFDTTKGAVSRDHKNFVEAFESVKAEGPVYGGLGREINRVRRRYQELMIRPTDENFLDEVIGDARATA
jgi:hypothetical protein